MICNPRIVATSSKSLLGAPVAEAPPLREQAYQRIRRAILVGELGPGTQLSPAAIARNLGISTMPVREALRLLEDEGLVETSARRWTRVRTTSPREAEEIYPLVGLLEEHAVTIGGEATRSQLAAMRRANRDLAAAAKAHDVITCLDADERFHAALVARCDNATLLRTIAELKARMRLLEGAFYRVESSARSIEQHQQAIDALAAGDRERAGALARENWSHGLAGVRATLVGDALSAD